MSAPKSHSGAGISPGHGGVQPPAQSSPTSYTPAGTGSRPGKSAYPIDTTAPKDPKGLDGRKTPGALA